MCTRGCWRRLLFPEGGRQGDRCSEGTRGCWRALSYFLREGVRYVLRGNQGMLEDMVLFPEGGGQVCAQRVPGDAGGHCAVS